MKRNYIKPSMTTLHIACSSIIAESAHTVIIYRNEDETNKNTIFESRAFDLLEWEDQE
jgi:hypothetical protein